MRLLRAGRHRERNVEMPLTHAIEKLKVSRRGDLAHPQDRPEHKHVSVAARQQFADEGERFLDIAERWTMLEIEAERLKASDDRHLAIGAVDAVAIRVLPPFLATLCDQQPPIRLHLESSSPSKRFSSCYSNHWA
ncbi:hypothetical protein [Caballeronia grimmiae]|uniref:hypothetical protein n=1 Tax=Caballeronia grimmiae TaxID=1071679 RepID=UPI0038BB2365